MSSLESGSLSKKHLREQAEEIVTPEWLALYEKANPQMARMNAEPVEGFEERRRAETRQLIESANSKRASEDKPPITLVGIHAASRGDTLSSQMLYRMTESAEKVGVKREIIEISNASGKVNPEEIERAVQQIRAADGFLISTQTKGGRFNSFMTMLMEALEDEDLHGKVVGFSHTYADPEKDEQVGPAAQAQSFFRSKGALMLPYTFMYANTAAKDEAWVQQDIEGNGVRLARGIERLTRSNLVNFLEDPDKLKERKENGHLSPEWQELKDKVAIVNQEREKSGEKPLNVLFVLGGEAPAIIEKEDVETGETKRVPGGRGARISKLVAKNFEFLGLQTDTIHLASQEDALESTAGNPNIVLSEVVEGREGDEADTAARDMYRKMLEADMIVFSSPVRWFNHTWHLQKMIERMTPLEASGFLLEPGD